MKKYLLFLGIIVIAAVGYWYFNTTTSTNSNKIKINILGETSATIQAMDSLEEKYEANNPNIDLIFHPNTFDDALTKSNQDFANKTGLYDIIMQYNFSLSSFVENNYVYSIDDLDDNTPKNLRLFEKDLLKTNWREVGYYFSKKGDKTEEQAFAYPFSAHSMLLMYNKDMFDNEVNKQKFKGLYGRELTPPRTWDDFYKVAEFFTDKEKNTYGICLGGSNDGYLYYTMANFFYGMNGKVLDKEVGWQGDANTKVLLNSKENIKALSLVRKLKPFNYGNFSSTNSYESMRIMKEGKTAMSMVWSDLIYPTIKEQNQFDNRFGFSPIPGNKSIFIGGAYFISKSSKHPQESFNYIVDLMQEENQEKLALHGLCPASLKIYEKPLVKKLPYVSALKESIKRGGVILEAGPDASIISEIITTYVQKCWNDEFTPEQALNKAQSEIEKKRKEIFKNLNN